MKCLIISNGNVCDDTFAKEIIRKNDFIICADGGARHLYRMKIVPDIIVGDLDSIGTDALDYFNSERVVFHKFPVQKDYTDTELAIQYAISQGYNEITFLGSMGSRMDHTIANIMLLLPLAKKGIKAKVLDENNEIHIIQNSIELEGNKGDYISLIPLSETVEGVSLEGFLYPLENATIELGSSLGISNQLQDTKAKIYIKRGILLVIKSQD